MKRTAIITLTAITLVTATGCLDVNLRESVSAGVFDFVSGTVVAILTDLVSLSSQ